jgi:hypothetical protein
MEVSEGELSEVVGVMKFSEPEVCTEGQDKDESVTVEVTILEKVWIQGGWKQNWVLWNQ